MNFYSILIYEAILVSTLLLVWVIRDLKQPGLFLNRYKKISYLIITLLSLIIICAIDARFIERNIIVKNEFDFVSPNLKSPLKVVFISDIHVGKYKKLAWTQKIVNNINTIHPDVILIGGDFISNEGTFEDETKYLEPLKELANKYPIYYVFGNHEYGVSGNTVSDIRRQTGDRSELLTKRMNELGISLLLNQLKCPKIKDETICLFGIDDIWGASLNFKELKNWDKNIPLILLAHNPDAVLFYPKDEPLPTISLTGHTHGGQIRLPFIGPLGDAKIVLPKVFYKGLNDWRGMKLFTSVGLGESGGPIRFWNPPEIAIINLKPQN
ncbi:MAG: hypothetical protein A2537_02770 [Candidatus Magasanikbacteria bacterium RIFOXYD2_FULL_36_9]|uniref:Calcineurin-like phosphoesterase domain-containing protein n=1 Tax=Candidatus Magasanikbacteria bacterium RIFOXYD2_FULL_36_9 TaxID=1798707 RepID=A0A1F6P0P0_9BACT|nr:MAG: hypothetical protein A2537_02770 [Candidatus Magasanikbacteria bacterium RIFOXYD2_FULL_36_9]